MIIIFMLRFTDNDKGEEIDFFKSPKCLSSLWRLIVPFFHLGAYNMYEGSFYIKAGAKVVL